MNLKQQFPYFVDHKWLNTRDLGSTKTFNLLDIQERKRYFYDKIGEEIEKLQDFLKSNTFIAHWLAPKMAGKGMYSLMLREILGGEYFVHISVGDLVRETYEILQTFPKKTPLYRKLKKVYRGVLSLDEAIDALLGRTQDKLLPSEFILALLKVKIEENRGKSIFIDGFPRSKDQVNYSLYMREMINYRDDPDFFILINIPISVIEERIKYRLVCPKCHTSRNLHLFPTSDIRFENGKFELYCDNPECEPVQLVPKEGDDKGIALIADRIVNDLKLMQYVRKMYGVNRIELFNAIEKDTASKYNDNYEFTKYFDFTVDSERKVVIDEKPFEIVENDIAYYSYLPAPVVIQLIRQLVFYLEL